MAYEGTSSGEHGGRATRVFRLVEVSGSGRDKTTENEAHAEVVSPSPPDGDAHNASQAPDQKVEEPDHRNDTHSANTETGDGNTSPNGAESPGVVSPPLATGDSEVDLFVEFEL